MARVKWSKITGEETRPSRDRRAAALAREWRRRSDDQATIDAAMIGELRRARVAKAAAPPDHFVEAFESHRAAAATWLASVLAGWRRLRGAA